LTLLGLRGTLMVEEASPAGIKSWVEDAARREDPDAGRGIPEDRRRERSMCDDSEATENILCGLGGSCGKIDVVHGVLEG
jgi:hypothetical protein